MPAYVRGASVCGPIPGVIRALVAQLDRASDFDSEGRRFESFRARQLPLSRAALIDPDASRAPNLTRRGYRLAVDGEVDLPDLREVSTIHGERLVRL